MKVLVTGATGFIGNYVIQELLNQEIEVIANAIEDPQELKFPWLDKVKYIKADLHIDNTNWFDYLEQPDTMIHLAWKGLPNYNELFHVEENFLKNYSFIKNMIMNGLKKVVVTGTCSEYGLQSGALMEDLVTKPNNAYAIAKDNLRSKLEELRNNTRFDFIWIRLFYMYGKGQNPNSLLSQLESSLDRNEKIFNLSGGEQLRDYLPVERVAENIVKISLQKEVDGIINCCSGKPISIRTLVENHLAKSVKKIELNFGYYPYSDLEPMAFWGEISKLTTALDN